MKTQGLTRRQSAVGISICTLMNSLRAALGKSSFHWVLASSPGAQQTGLLSP